MLRDSRCRRSGGRAAGRANAGPTDRCIRAVAFRHRHGPDRTKVRPQDDLSGYVNGKWFATTEIPPDKAAYSAGSKIYDDTQLQLRGIVEKESAQAHPKPGAPQRIGDFYASFMDEARLEQLGVKPLQGELANIAALKDKKELPALMARLGKIGVGAPFDIGVHQDDKDSTKYVVDIGQGGLGLPDRDYYLKDDDKKLAETRAKYQQHVEKMLALAGDKNAAANAKAIVAFETELARVQWTQGRELRDPVKTYNKIDLVAKLPSWRPASTGSAGSTPPASRQGRLRDRRPAELPDRPSPSSSNEHAAATWKAYLSLAPARAYARLPVEGVRRRAVSPSTARRCAACRRTEPRWKRGVEHRRARDGRGGRQALRRQVLPAGEQGAHGRAGRRTCWRPTSRASTRSTG